MSNDNFPFIVRITSSIKNSRFGTGFVIRRTSDKVFVITCAHVVNQLMHKSQVLVENQIAYVVSIGDEASVDLAVLETSSNLTAETLEIDPHIGNKRITFQTVGHQRLGSKLSLLPLSGKLGKHAPLIDKKTSQRIDAWRIEITDDDELHMGFSGAPIINKETGKAIAVISDRFEKGKEGIAISINAISLIWDGMTNLPIQKQMQMQFNKEQYVLFVGSQIYKDATLATHEQMFHALANNINLPRGFTPFRIAQSYANTQGRQNLERFVKHQAVLPQSTPMPLHEIIAQLNICAVITTTYDTLIEQALEEKNKKYERLKKRSILSLQKSIVENKVLISKLFGDHSNYEPLLITQKDMRNYLVNNQGVRDLLKNLISKYPVLYIGYDFASDEFRFLQEEILDELGAHNKQSYAIMQNEDKFSRASLAQFNIQLIGIPSLKNSVSYHDYLGRILQSLVSDAKSHATKNRELSLESKPLQPYILDRAEQLTTFSLTLNTIKLNDSQRPPPVHLCVILDVSGSMNTPNKYPLLINAIPLLLKSLTESDYLTIIIFSTKPELIITAQKTKHTIDATNIIQRINHSHILFGNETRMAGALKLAVKQITSLQNASPNVVHRTYFFTDGEIHDLGQCVAINPQLRQINTEIYAYGLGEDFSRRAQVDEIRRGCPGASTKPLFNVANIQDTFAHIGELTKRIIGYNAKITIRFSDDVIAGDMFRYRPSEYLGTINEESNLFEYLIGTIEYGRSYNFLGEIKLYPRHGGKQVLGRVTLSIYRNGKNQIIKNEIIVTRTSDEFLCTQKDNKILEASTVLKAFRSQDKSVLLDALRIRHKNYIAEKRDPELIRRIAQAIKDLQDGYSLTKEQERHIDVVTITRAYTSEEDAARYILFNEDL